MITFYRTKDCPGCKAIEETLGEMSLAHEVVVVTKDNAIALPEGTRAPVLVDGGEVVEGNQEIRRHLEKLEAFKEQWYKFQSDACYCDEEGNVE